VAEISASAVKELREKTGAGMMDCKKALTESGGDFGKAEDYLRKKGLAAAAKKAGRVASEGAVASYVHMGGKIGVLVELSASADEETVKDVAMHIAAADPRFVNREAVPESVISEEREIARAQAPAGKPPQVVEKIVDGKVAKFFEQVCLIEQQFVREPEKKVADILKAKGEVSVKSFLRFRLGEGASADEK
jgi:elongation factor Ts